MTDKKAVFFDIDHTLFSHTLDAVPASAITALKKLKAAGSKIAICTSRTWEEMVNVPEEVMDLMDGIVCAQGGMIIDHGEVISVKTIDDGDAERVINYCREHGLVIRYGGAHGENSHDLHYTHEISDIFYKLYRMRPGQTLWKHQPLVNIIFYTRDEQQVQEVGKLLTSSHLMPMKFSNEVTGPNVNKASGLLELAGHWGFEQKDTVAFGDGYNDVEMIRTAGLGVAMGNGCDAVKEAADFVADDIDNDAIYKTCIQYNLIEEE